MTNYVCMYVCMINSLWCKIMALRDRILCEQVFKNKIIVLLLGIPWWYNDLILFNFHKLKCFYVCGMLLLLLL